MIVCLCEAVNDQQIRAAIAAGNNSVSAIKGACGAGSDCGACCSMVRRLLRQESGGSMGRTSRKGG